MTTDIIMRCFSVPLDGRSGYSFSNWERSIDRRLSGTGGVTEYFWRDRIFLMNGNNLQAIPTIDELLSDATKAATLSPEIARTMLAGLAGLLPVLIAQSTRDTTKAEALPSSERWLTVEEASTLFGVKPRWLRTNKDKLPHSKPSHKVLVFPEEKLRKWFAAHKAH